MPSTRRTTLVLVGLVLLALNLRPAAVSVGPVLAEVRDGLGMSATSAGLLTSLPVLAFAFSQGLIHMGNVLPPSTDSHTSISQAPKFMLGSTDVHSTLICCPG